MDSAEKNEMEGSCLQLPGGCKQRFVFSEQSARTGKAVASDHLHSSSYGASANLAMSRHSGATAERLPYLRRYRHKQRTSRGSASNAPPQSKMESQSNYGDMDPIKSISNILREPTPLSPPSSQSGDESSETAAGSATIAAHDAVKAASDSSRSRGSGASLWRLLVLFVEPISSRLRTYLVGPLHAKLDDHAAETQADSELIQLQLKLIRADLEYLPKQLAQVEVRYQSLAKQLAELESKFGILTDQLKNLESTGEGTMARPKPAEHPDPA